MPSVIPEQKQAISPKTGESYADFVWRAHYSLLSSIPNPDQRNQVVWNSWESMYGDREGDRAVDFFGDKYSHPDERVCYFMEHNLPRVDGTSIKYDFNELCRMIDAANRRCDTNCYSAIASHHTESGKKGPDVEPKVIGFAGPYHLGMVDQTKPQWAIFADEHHDNRYSQTFDDRRRRSVEVMRPKNGDPSWFDPIATLGADSPRLPLPIARYAADGVEVEVFRYSMPSSFTSAGAGNTYIPGSSDRRDKYQDQPEQNTMGGFSQLTPEDVQQIVNALMATPQMSWVSEQMETNQGQQGQQPQIPPSGQQPSLASPPVGQPATQPGQPAPDPNSPPPNQCQSMPNLSVPNGTGGGGVFQPPHKPQQPQRYSASDGQENEMSTVDVERYAAIENELIETRERYSQLESEHTKLAQANLKTMEQMATMHESLYKMEQHTVDAERTSRIKDLYAAYPQMVDVEEELDQVLYSRGGTMDKDSFEKHVATIERFAKRSPIATTMIPDGSLGNFSTSGDKARTIKEAVITRYSRGDIRSYDEIQADVVKELGFTA